MMDEDELNESARVAPRTGARYESRQIGLLIAGGVLAVVVVFALGILVGRYLMGGSAPRNEAIPGQPAAPPVVKAVPKEEKPAVVPPPSLSQLPPAPPVALPALPPSPAPVEAKTAAASKPVVEAKPAEPAAKAPSPEKAKDPAAKKEPDRFTFYRTLTAKKESEKSVDLKPAKKEKQAPAKKAAKADQEKTAAKKPDKSEEAAGKAKEKAAKAPAKEESAAAAPKPAANRYVVQVGSYRQESDAEKIAGELRDKGYQVQVTPADLGEKGKWYRVRVGSPAAKEEAEIRAKEFEEKEKKKAAVLSE
ncbi:MAG: SPOR domain-containing protein [Nitrospirae bacterium]|nr:SPOR domain-containing protein [Nitrospirota bacterium]